ncbi:hypothetical protein ARMGADRAFT_1029448 [Armillaria gallica]|uniref:JmjC domain-containing protein n=1 Tax=Armillaria gallica TaxID=47427 RepID=A0A2H3DGG7_ARMGA|nr:hypothetical protein ARMGADRAFT_1029448 [Armillaria gallica]
MRLKLDHDVRDWVRTHYEVVSERFPGMLELTNDILIITFPTLMHQYLMVVINNAIINAELYREVYIKENIDYPLQGGGSKNLDCAIFAQNPEKDLKDLWPRFIFEIAFADSGRKCLRDLLKSLLCIRHRTLIGGELAIKVFRNTKGEITKIIWHLVSFILDATQDLTSTKHRDMEPFELYTKLLHPHNMKGKWILSEGEQADIGDDVKANIGTKFQTYQDTNSLGARTFQIDKNSLSPEYDVIINSNVMVGPGHETFRLPAKAIWVERSAMTNFMQAVQKWLHFCAMPNPSLLLFQPKNKKLESAENYQRQHKLAGYDSLKQSSLLWSIPVQCQQFLTMSLTPKEWISKCIGSGRIDPIFAEFGLAMSKILKSTVDTAWHKAPIPEGFNIDSLKNASAQKSSKFLNHLDKWPDKLESMRLNLQMSDETNLVPLPLLTPNATPTDKIIHGDVCILATHWKHDSMKQWVKSLSVLEGVAFHIRLLTHHGSIEKLALWKSFIHANYDHMDIPRIVQDDDMMKRFIWQLGKWKQAFATAVAISPLILIMGQGLGQTPSAAAALQVGGHMYSHGKPALIQEIELMLWHCIIGIAWCRWTSQQGLETFLDKVRPLVTAYEEDKQEEENWFTNTVNCVQCKGIVGFQDLVVSGALAVLVSDDQKGETSFCLLCIPPLPKNWFDVKSSQCFQTYVIFLEEDDRATIEGWNKCIVANEDDTPRWYNPNRTRTQSGRDPGHLVGDLDAPQEVQDHQKQMDPEKRDDINIAMSFRELFCEGQGIETISYLLTFSVHRTVFDQTEDLPRDLFPQEFPKQATTWSLVSICGAITYIHSDSQEWEPGFIPDPKDWDAEVVLLEPGTIFFMRLDTHHVVITIENSIVVGEHFYACTTLSRSVAGYVHTAMLDFSITNILHLELRPLLLRMMCYFSQNIHSKNTLASNIPNIYHHEGFLDLVALGNLCLFASGLNVDPEEGKHAVMVAVTAYKALLRWASRNLSLVIWCEAEGTSESDEEEEGMLESDEQDVLLCIDPADFAWNSAAHFARSLNLYALKVKDECQGEWLLDAKVLIKQVWEAMKSFMNTDVTKEFIEAYKERKQWMHFKLRFVVTWSGNISDFDSEHEKEEDDDQDNGEEYCPPKPRKGQVAQIPASSEESTINVSNSDVMNTNVNLGGGETSFALIPASGILEALTVNMSNNAVMDVDKAEALLSSSPAIRSQQSTLKVNNPDVMDCDDEMGVGTAKVEDKCERGLDGQVPDSVLPLSS